MKIFGIGLSKTGTTSLAHALDILGYKTRDYPGIEHYSAGDLASVDAGLLEAHDALTDTPIPSFYRELDARYPGARFILTVRDAEGWLKSCKKQFTEKLAAKQNEAHNQLFMDLYGCTAFDEQKFRAGYEAFVAGVMEYFKDRPQDLLVINVVAGEGWEKLCPFLGKPVPEIPFPKANVTQITWMNLDDLVAVARRAGQIVLRAQQKRQNSGAVGKLLHTLGGGDAAALQRAVRAAHDAIADGLAKLTPQTAVLSRDSHAVPYAERAHWNHVWLVDPLDGADAFLGGGGEFTVNIALVQDGSPIYGVVYAPATDTVYAARIGKGAFKQQGDAVPRQLEPGGAATEAVRGSASASPPPGSRALAMCQVAEGSLAACRFDTPLREWEAAAAHLVAASAGKRVVACESKQALKYNTEPLQHECVVVASAASAGQ